MAQVIEVFPTPLLVPDKTILGIINRMNLSDFYLNDGLLSTSISDLHDITHASICWVSFYKVQYKDIVWNKTG